MYYMEIPKIINKAELARELFPNNSAAPAYLDNKLKGRCRARITDSDRKSIIEILEKAIKELKK